MLVVCGIGSKYRNRISKPGQNPDFGLDHRVLGGFFMLGTIRNGVLWAACFALAMLATTGARASSIFFVETNTSSLSGSGYIDLQYAGNAGAGASTATITGFSTNGSLGGAATVTLIGDASGDLASTVTILNGALNSSGLNEYNEAIAFGTFTEFEVALSDPVGGTANSGFALSFYANDDSTPVLSTSLSGASASLTVEPDGTVTITTYPDVSGAVDTIVTRESQPSPVPEPPAFWAFGAGLALLAGGVARTRFLYRA
jgi:hypothetical protein